MFSLTQAVTISPLSHLKTFLSQFKNRGRIGIVVDILDTVSSDRIRGRTKTQIMRGAGLSYEQTCRYLNFLTMCDLVRGRTVRQGDREFLSYYLTSHGFELIKQLYSIHAAIRLVEQKFV